MNIAIQQFEKVEWTPSINMDPSTHLPSTWKGPIGRPLTNRRINQYAAEGRYGPQAKEKARAKMVTRSGIVLRCECGASENIRYLKWSYLPKRGWYCLLCVSKYQQERDREEQLKNRWKVAAKLEYC